MLDRLSCFFFFNDTATTEIYTYCHTLSLHDALPIGNMWRTTSPPTSKTNSTTCRAGARRGRRCSNRSGAISSRAPARRSEEHTSELQSLMRISYAVFCLKKKQLHPDHCHPAPQHNVT